MTKLVIVESPAKAKTIAGYLGDDFVVESSIGHVRDLPQRAADVPKAFKGEPWANLGIDVDNDFKPLYLVNRDKKDQIAKLKGLLASADELFLATDEDREGEAIAWHLLEVLNPKVPVHRMVFHEITRTAIAEALTNVRELDRHLVDAQEARRLFDRLYGYEVSPVLWKKIATGLSAGRVQSVATRIVVERERDRMAFVPAGYWDLDLTLRSDGDEFPASLIEVDGRRVAGGRDFGDDGRLVEAAETADVTVLDEASARALAGELTGTDPAVASVESKPYRRRPAAPFITSTFQQEAGRRLKLSSSLAMHAAQGLYEKGYITYMRTDSTTLSTTALAAARTEIAHRFGPEFVPAESRSYAGKVRNAQEAHEAIRPAGDAFRHPDEVADQLPRTEAQVYEMIWQRTVASQMTDAVGETVQVRFAAAVPSGQSCLLGASGTVITHLGFRRAYVEQADDAPDASDREAVLPEMAVGDLVAVHEVAPDGHTTQPPARFTEASLVKRLEELGVGRPSTYASIMETIQARDYVWKKGSALVPTLSAFAVTTLLETHFPKLVGYDFTARMEDDLDAIANGSAESVPWLHAFYFGGDDDPGLKAKVSDRLGDIDAKAVSTVELGVHEGQRVMACFGKIGPYVQAGDATRSIPDDVAPDELTVEMALEFLNTPLEQVLGVDPDTGLEVIARSGRFGPYVSLGRLPEPLKPSPELQAVTALGLNRKEIRVALAHLRLTAPSVSDAVIDRILNTPPRGIGKGARDALADFRAAEGIGLLEALERVDETGIAGRARNGVGEFLKLRARLQRKVAEGPGAVVASAMSGSGYAKSLRSDGSEGKLRLANVEQLIEALDGFADVADVCAQLDALEVVDDTPPPRTASLFSTMTLERITLDDALQLLSLPRVVGVDPSDGEEITVQNGRFGPYLRKGKDSRSLSSEEQLFTITLDDCLTLLAQPKQRGRAAARPPLAELGDDPASGRPVLLKDGRFGPYVTDGEYNASLRRGDSVEELSAERAFELLAERRAKGPAPAKGRKAKGRAKRS